MTRTILLLTILCAAPALAQDATPAAMSGPGVILHAPPVSWEEGEKEYRLFADVSGTWTANRVEALVRRPNKTGWTTILFKRHAQGNLVATFPSALVRSPGLEYYLRSVEPDGTTRMRFATDQRPHRVVVKASEANHRERVLLARHDHHRIEVTAEFHHVNMGSASPTDPHLDTIPHKTDEYADWYHLLEVYATYRFLEPGIYHIRFGYGMLGGHLGTTNPDRAAWEALPQEQRWDGAPMNPGLYYGFASAYWEFGGWGGIEPRIIMGASHEGFEGGAGVLVRFGPLTRTHFDVAYESISNLGWRYLMELTWDTVPYVEMSLRSEITNYPMDGDRATIPSFNFKVNLDPILIHGTIGYGLRKNYSQGGVTFGGGVSAVF